MVKVFVRVGRWLGIVLLIGTALTSSPLMAAAQTAGKGVATATNASSNPRATIDTTVSPCDDFDQYVNGRWRMTADAQPRNILEDALGRVDRHLLRLLDSATRVALRTTDPTLRALGTLNASCLVADSASLGEIAMAREGKSTTPGGRAITTRAEACLVATHQVLGPALHAVYVRDVMSLPVATEGRALVASIRAAVRAHVYTMGWLGDSMQRRLATILDTMTLRIQFAPDTVDYTRLVLQPTQYAANLATIAAWEKAEYLRRRDTKPVRHTMLESPLVPYAPIVQARRGAPVIEVTPLFFQPPFFDATAESAANYAVLGSTLAHEMWHLLTPFFKWMQNTEGRRRVSVLVEQYTKFARSGWGTVNEDLSDVGGILSAYTAWQQTARATAAARLDGFTPEQQFFLYYARSWRSVDGLSFDRYHSDMRTRVNGVLRQVPAFAQAFGCTDSDAMMIPLAQRADVF